MNRAEEPVDRGPDREKDRVPPGPRDPERRKSPIVEPPPTPRDQPDGTGEPEHPNGGDPINPPIDEPARDGND